MKRPAIAALAMLLMGGAGELRADVRERAGRCLPYDVELAPVAAEFRPVVAGAQPAGWETPHAAALAFYDFHGASYLASNTTTELVGFLLRSEEGRYFFTTAAEVPYAFELTARVARPLGWTVDGVLHTHPGGRPCQEEFSVEDRRVVLRGGVPRSYVRTPLGNVLFLDRQLARTTSTRWGAAGVSICPAGEPCLAAHQATGTAYASR
jgi:hypothetical protein